MSLVPKMQHNPPFATTAKQILFYLGATLILVIPLKTPFYIYDEGFAVVNATRLLAGDLPYKDIWAIYPPGQQYALAAVFALFGTSLSASRLYDILIRLVLVVVVFHIVRRLSASFQAYLAGMIMALLLASVTFYAYAVYPALALGLLSFWSTLKYQEAPRLRWLSTGGALAGTAGLFRWDIGLYTGLGLGAAIIFQQLCASLQAKQSLIRSVSAVIKPALAFEAAAFAILLVGYGLVSLISGLRNVWEQVFLFPVTQLHAVRWLAYPDLLPHRWFALSELRQIYSEPLDWLRFYLPLAIYLVAGLSVAHRLLVRRAASDTHTFGELAALLFGALLFFQALSRYDYIHVLPTLILALVSGMATITHLFSSPSHPVLKVSLGLLLLPMAIVYFSAPVSAVLQTLDFFPPWGCYSQVERAGCAFISENQQRAVLYVRSQTRPGEAIYLGNTRHDVVFVNDAGFYFLADRPPATRYSELHPGVATTQPVQQEIVAEIGANKVKFLVLVDMWVSNEPNESGVSSGVTVLDRYIRSHFSRVTGFGEYQVWQRNEP
jgi:hypothetical protein